MGRGDVAGDGADYEREADAEREGYGHAGGVDSYYEEHVGKVEESAAEHGGSDGSG